MAPITLEALVERIDGLRELMASLHDQRMLQMAQVLEKLNDINGRTRANTEMITRNCTLIEGLRSDLSEVKADHRDSLNRRSILIGISEMVLALAAWLTPKP